MFQRIRQWFMRAAPLPVMRAEAPTTPPTVPARHHTFPHKPETLPCVEGFRFEALLLDGRVLRGKVMMLGGARRLLLLRPGALVVRAEAHSLQGWRHVE